ncbi:syntaxin-1A homolog [Tigriopus californicus]|uniref:syntaxin-1A homolog n=1 Tax=Tigriopus californicus TaxID=6832 RepID=UPI0027D9DB38|nr:syntaxin-1A homolog [Tigriopus californicus]
MVKDRLQELNIIRDNGSEEDLSRRNDQNQGEFFALIEEIRHDLEILGSNIEGSKKIQNKIISDPLNRAKLQADLSDVKQAIKKKASMIKTKLNQVAQISAKDESSTAGRIQKTVLTTTVQNFVESMRNYNGIQADHQDKVIGQIQRMKDIGAVDEDRDTETGTELMQAQMAKQQLNDLEARFSHFTKLEDSIEEMRDMFLDMNMLVESQGEVIDRIESHVQNAEVDVEHAAEQTKIARKYQSLARRKKIYLITCVVLTLVILITAVLLAIFL